MPITDYSLWANPTELSWVHHSFSGGIKLWIANTRQKNPEEWRTWISGGTWNSSSILNMQRVLSHLFMFIKNNKRKIKGKEKLHETGKQGKLRNIMTSNLLFNR